MVVADKKRKSNSGRFKKGMIPHNKGKKATAEVKKKISEALNRPEVKKKISESKKGAKNPMFGKHPSDETLKKRSNSLKGREQEFLQKNHIFPHVSQYLATYNQLYFFYL